jgi:transposase-like protein
MYTTNSIENINRQLRKVTKSKTIFPTDFSLEKSLYLSMMNATEMWTSRMKGWDQILA